MKKTVFALFAAMVLCMGLTGCKSESDAQADNDPAPNASGMPNMTSGENAVRVPAANGFVTDGNGIIGDDDDLVTRYEKNNENPVERIGDTVSNIAEDTGDAISNAAENVRDYVSDITDTSPDTSSDISQDTSPDIFPETSVTEISR